MIFFKKINQSNKWLDENLVNGFSDMTVIFFKKIFNDFILLFYFALKFNI